MNDVEELLTATAKDLDAAIALNIETRRLVEALLEQGDSPQAVHVLAESDIPDAELVICIRQRSPA
jgi:hypothetical protein